jgi:hypothetical protein
MRPPIIARGPGRRAFAMLLGLTLAAVLAACGDGLSLVAVNPDDTPLPFKTPRVDEDGLEPEADSPPSAATESESATQPAIPVDSADAPQEPDPSIVETEPATPPATPEPATDAPPTLTDAPAEPSFDSADPAERAAWRLAVIEDSSARLVALRPFDIHPDLLVASEYSDPQTIFGEEASVGAMDAGLTSVYAVFSISALPWESEVQFAAPLFFFEQVLVHDSPEGAQRFLLSHGDSILDWLVESSRNALEQTLPGILDTSVNPELVEIPFGNATEVTGAVVRWPTTPAGVGLTPSVYIVFVSHGDTTIAYAIGNGDEAWNFRVFSVLEAALARLS